jgi:imidazolonepropionase-like amidohydrolase
MQRRETADFLVTAGFRLRIALALAAAGIFATASLPSRPAALAGAEAPGAIFLKAAAVHVGDGRVIEGGAVIVRGGKIEAVGSGLAVPEGALVIEMAEGSITPGLIDASARLEPKSVFPPPGRVAGSQEEAGSEREAPTPPELFSLSEFFKSLGGTPSAPGERAGEAGEISELQAERERAGGPEGQRETQEGREGEAAAPEIPEGRESPADPGGPFESGVRTTVTGEQSSEVVPHTRVLDGLDLESPDFLRLARGGVTTVYASPDPSAVIGARGAILKTAGPAARRVLAAEAAVHAVIGSEPSFVGTSNFPARRRSSSLYTRRPTTRMGVVWVFRKAFYDTLARSQGLPVGGADTPPAAASRVLLEVLESKIPLRIQACTLPDITTAFRLSREFKIPFVLEEATEAHRAIDLLRAPARNLSPEASPPSAEKLRGQDLLQPGSTPVIFGPIEAEPSGIRRVTRDDREARFHTFRILLEAGIVTALSARDLREEDGLARQAMYAIRFGVAPEAALQAVTLTPARLLGIDGSVGTLQAGKDADLVVWSGKPFAATSAAVLVMVSGEIVCGRESPRDRRAPAPGGDGRARKMRV